ncbi:MAG: cation transporter [Propylenella sp.]
MLRKLTFVGLLLAASLTLGSAAAGERTVTLAVENMTCALCPLTVQIAIAAVPGVASVDVDFETKTAIVTFDDSASDVADLAAASANAGYPARLLE